MKAIVLTKYGSPDGLELQDVARPAPRDNEVLIKVHAACINSWDGDLLRGVPFVNRLMAGVFRPTRLKILGCDIAGRVESVGKNVKRIQPGDEVFADLSGSGWGGFAEYVCSDEKPLAIKPGGISFVEAAAIPQAGVLALQGLRKGGILPETMNPENSAVTHAANAETPILTPTPAPSPASAKKVLINGAGGGVGSFAIPMAKLTGAEVTAVDSGGKMDFMRSLGADYVIDYKQEDFTRNGQQYDLILDVMGRHSLFDYRRALSEKGVYVMVGGATSLVNQVVFLAPWYAIISSRKMSLLLHKPDVNDLDILKGFIASGTISPVIDIVYPLTETAEAMRYFAEGGVKGKVVISMDNV